MHVAWEPRLNSCCWASDSFTVTVLGWIFLKDWRLFFDFVFKLFPVLQIWFDFIFFVISSYHKVNVEVGPAQFRFRSANLSVWCHIHPLSGDKHSSCAGFLRRQQYLCVTYVNTKGYSSVIRGLIRDCAYIGHAIYYQYCCSPYCRTHTVSISWLFCSFFNTLQKYLWMATQVTNNTKERNFNVVFSEMTHLHWS